MRASTRPRYKKHWKTVLHSLFTTIKNHELIKSNSVFIYNMKKSSGAILISILAWLCKADKNIWEALMHLFRSRFKWSFPSFTKVCWNYFTLEYFRQQKSECTNFWKVSVYHSVLKTVGNKTNNMLHWTSYYHFTKGNNKF